MKETPEFIKLQQELLQHKYNYYILDSPTISDYDYDMLELESFKMAKSLGFNADRFEDPAPEESHHIHWMIGYKENSIYST